MDKRVMLLITQTSKPYGRHGVRSTYNESREFFKSLEKAWEHLELTYGILKREKLYVDGPDGQGKHVGYIFQHHKVREYDRERGEWRTYSLHDWVGFYQYEYMTPDKRR